jgi:hypothetical protein
MRPRRAPSRSLPAALLLAWAASAGAATVDLRDPELVDSARATPVGGALRLTGIELGPGTGSAVLELERFQIFAPGAGIVIHGERGEDVLPPPANVYFHGLLEEARSIRAALSVLAGGEVRGMLAGGGRFWILSNRLAGTRLSAPMVREVEPGELAADVERFACGSESIAAAAASLRTPPVPAGPSAEPAPAGTTTYSATVAVESDFEYFQRFGNAVEAVDYAADLVAYSQVVYAPEVDTELRVGSVSLWTTPADPWQQFGPACGLFEFGRYWNDNRDHVPRTLTHFLSGKNNGGGIAWVGVLCSDEFDFDITPYNCPGLAPAVDNYGGDYGYSGDLDGNFDLGNPAVLWDVVVTAHEMGHNFNSPHTHCYNGIGGSASPVDMCYGSEPGCYAGPTSLPGPGCSGPGNGCGTIMSYCHLLGGGIANISWTFGEGHPYGVLPHRVPDRMSTFVASTHAAAPLCLPLSAVLFADGFEGGNTNAWDATVD